MIVNPEKFQAILLNKRISYLTNLKVNVDDKAIKSVRLICRTIIVYHIGDKLEVKLEVKLHSILLYLAFKILLVIECLYFFLHAYQ